MNKRVVMAIVLGSMAGVAFSPAGAVASRPMAAFIKFDGLMAGAGSDRGYPNSVVVTDVRINGSPIESCGAVEKLDNDPVGMISVHIALTKGYMDEASVGLHERAESGELIREAVLSIEAGGKRCSITFGKLSKLTVERRGRVDEVTIRYGEIRPSTG